MSIIASSCCLMVSFFNKTALQLILPVSRRIGWRPVVPTSLQRMNGRQILQIWIHWTTTSGVQCWKPVTNCNENPRPFRSWKSHCRSGLTYYRHQSTKQWKTSPNVCRHAFQSGVDILNMRCKLKSDVSWQNCPLNNFNICTGIN